MTRKYRRVELNIEKAAKPGDPPLLWDRLSKASETSGKPVQAVIFELIDLALTSLDHLNEAAAEEELLVKLATGAEVGRVAATKSRALVVG